MKKRVMSIVVALALMIGLCGSSTQVFFINAKAEETTPDVQLSIKTDKTELRPGDEVTVTVSVDSFRSSLTGDHDSVVNVVPDDASLSGKPMITTYQIQVPIDTNVFEYVSKGAGVVKKGAINYDASEKTVKAAAVYSSDDMDNIIQENQNGKVLFSFVLKVKSDVAENQEINLGVDESALTLKNMYLTTNEKYKVTAKPASFNIIAKEVSNISLSRQPDKTSYYVGADGLDVMGGKVKVTYSNGETGEVDLINAMCSDVDFTTAGEKEVTVTYEGKTTTFKVQVVQKQAVSFTLKGVENKNVTEGMNLNLEGMSADVTYDDGSVGTVNLTADMLTYNTDKIGNVIVQVKIGKVTNSFTVKVVAKELEFLELIAQPEKVVYLVNQKFDATGLIVQAVYNNGTQADVTKQAKVSSVDLSKAGVQSVNVTYTENDVTKSVTFNIDVKSKDKVNAFNKDVTALLSKQLTVDDKIAISELRNTYSALSEVEKAEANETGLIKLETQIKELTTESETTQPSENTSADNTVVLADTTNEAEKEPKTGDTAPVAGFVFLFVAAGAGLIYITMPKYKKRNK